MATKDNSPVVAYWPMAVIGGVSSSLEHVQVAECDSVDAARALAEQRANDWARMHGDDTYVSVQTEAEAARHSAELIPNNGSRPTKAARQRARAAGAAAYAAVIAQYA